MQKRTTSSNEKPMIAYYRFIRDDVRLGAKVFPNGKQWLLMEQFDIESGNIILKDALECIHTAVQDIPVGDFSGVVSDEDFEKDILKVRSSENMRIIHLPLDEKFKAFKSWVAGIAEAGMEAFELQAEIEAANNFVYPITDRLLAFMIRVDQQFLPRYLIKAEQESEFEGIRHESFVISKLIPILSMILMDLFSHHGDISKAGRNSLDLVIEFSPPDKIFLKNINFCFLLSYKWEYYEGLIQRLETQEKPINLIDEVTGLIIKYGNHHQNVNMSIFSPHEQTNLIFIYLNNFLREINIGDRRQKKLVGNHVKSFIKHIKNQKISMNIVEYRRILEMIYNWSELHLNMSFF